VAGLDADVTIRRDPWGIAHVEASTIDDLFFGQGFVTAQDRLWHLEWDRLRALGTMAALTGAPADVVADSFARRARLPDASRRGYAALSDQARAACDAHAAGVNAAMGVGGLPVELQALGASLEPWEGWHCVAVFVIRHVNFATWQHKLWRARVLATLGADAVNSFRLEGSVGDTPVIVPPGVRAAVGVLSDGGLFDAAALDGPGRAATAALEPLGLQLSGSNAWVVAGSRTATGAPILAGDPHRTFEVPNVYYQIHLAGPEIDAAGFSFPGVPGVAHFAQTEHVAWGVTNAMADYQDLYVERLPDAVTDERIEYVEVNGAEPVPVECLLTRHGPVVVGDRASGVGVALASTGLQAAGGSLDCVLGQLRARSIDELDEVLRGWVEPANNFVMADRHGAIGYRTGGRIPRRTPINAVLPVPGWTDAHDWVGFVPDAELPRARNPQIGAIVTANQRVTEREYAHLLNYDAYGASRADRIWARLGDRTDLDLADHAAVQADAVSLAARRFIELVPHPLWAGWDGDMAASSPAAALYGLARDHLVRRVVEDLPSELRANPFAAWEPPSTALPASLRVANALDGMVAADDRSLVAAGLDWAGLGSEAVAAAEAELRRRFGDDPSAWTWGALHEATPLHALRQHDQLRDLVRPTSPPLSGASGTVLATNQNSGMTTSALSGSVARYLWDLADRSRSRWIVPLGTSGHPASPHFTDQQDLWAAVQTVEVLTDPATIAAQAIATLHLEPGAAG